MASQGSTDSTQSFSAEPRQFRDVLESERQAIRERREAAGESGASTVDDLFGVALSGGGIRSASFCLGALQALDSRGLIGKADYLSTVSGGGYAGASMIAALTRDGEFPFLYRTSADAAPRIRDSEPLSHIRDHGNFLGPDGIVDIAKSLAVVLRGLAVNIVLLGGFLLAAAILILVANPTTEQLGHSVLLDVVDHFFEPDWAASTTMQTLHTVIGDRFILSKLLVCALFAWLVGWGLKRSWTEGSKAAGATDVFEPSSAGAATGWVLMALALGWFVLELQPVIVGWLIERLDRGVVWTTGLQSAWAAAAAVLTVTATFRQTLAGWIERALGSESTGAQIRAAVARMAFLALGLALPLLIYGVFLVIVIWGIRVVPPSDCEQMAAPAKVVLQTCSIDCPYAPSFVAPPCNAPIAVRGGTEACASTCPPDRGPAVPPACQTSPPPADAPACVSGYPFGPAFLSSPDGWLAPGLAVAIALFLAFRGALTARLLRRERRLRTVIKSAARTARPVALPLVTCLGMLALGAYATRAADPDAPQTWRVLLNYGLLLVAVLVVSWNFTENANSLHRLYRDRLGDAFRLGLPSGPLALTALARNAPYLLVNAALNARLGANPQSAGSPQKAASRNTADAQGLGGSAGDVNPPTDPAKRGRKADFFLFSRLFVGSDSTGYVDTRAMVSAEPELDLATAVAISGAAVSSSMGRVGIGLLGPTLALLNLRLGFWLKNPAFLGVANPPARLLDSLRLYLFNEAFGLMRADRPLVYVTDGGHIDNLGLYQLLKRRCRIVVVVDGEADPGLNFGAFCDVQRFIRIDEGVRVDLDWRPVREAALARASAAGKTRPEGAEVHSRHCAVGRITYDDGTPDGFLLYVKASVTGDEADYVLDYERRYPMFPHESTADQFFSEEQMEAYRALGFHAMDRALDPDDAGHPTAAQPSRSAVDALLRDLASRAPPP